MGRHMENKEPWFSLSSSTSSPGLFPQNLGTRLHFRVYEETRDQPMPRPFPAPPIFLRKSPGDEVVSSSTL